MRILSIVPHSPAAVGYSSQVEFVKTSEYHHELCRAVADRGHDIEFWHYGSTGRTTTHDYGHTIRQFRAYNRGTFGSEISPSLYCALLRSDADVVHIHGIHMTNHIPIYLIEQLRSHTFVVQNHGSALDTSKALAKLWYTTLQLILPPSTKVLSVNDDEASNLRSFSVGRSVQYLRNGVDTEKYAPIKMARARDELGLQSDTQYVVSVVGRISRSKGLTYLVSAMEDVPATLLIIYGGGDDDQRASLEQQAAESDASVEFVGSVYGNDLVRYYNAADVCAFPSTAEGFGVVLLEAMACGTPTVGTTAHQGGQGHLEDERTGLVAETESASSLAKQINRILSDASLREQLSEEARLATVDRFGWDVVADELLSIYSPNS